MVWLHDGEKFEDMITRFDIIHERDRQQDGRTDRYLTRSSLRGKNWYF